VNHEGSPHFPFYHFDFKGESDYTATYKDSPRTPTKTINPKTKVKLGLGVKEFETKYNQDFRYLKEPKREELVYPRGNIHTPTKANPKQYTSNHRNAYKKYRHRVSKLEGFPYP